VEECKPPGGRLLDANSIGKIETASATQYSEATVTVDNLMSKAHTVFQMRTRDRKGLLYDALRVSKDLKVVRLSSCTVEIFLVDHQAEIMAIWSPDRQ